MVDDVFTLVPQGATVRFERLKTREDWIYFRIEIVVDEAYAPRCEVEQTLSFHNGDANHAAKVVRGHIANLAFYPNAGPARFSNTEREFGMVLSNGRSGESLAIAFWMKVFRPKSGDSITFRLDHLTIEIEQVERFVEWLEALRPQGAS